MSSYFWKPWGLLLLVVWLRSSESSAQADASDIYAVATPSESTIIIVDAQGRLLRTTDGRSFVVSSLTDVPMYGVSFANANVGIAVGDSGALFRSSDGGETWTRQDSGTINPLLSVSLVDENIATVVGFQGTILRTVDGGATWMPQELAG